VNEETEAWCAVMEGLRKVIPITNGTWKKNRYFNLTAT